MTDIFGPHTNTRMNYREREVVEALAERNRIIYPLVLDDGYVTLREHGPFNFGSGYRDSTGLDMISGGYIIPLDLVDVRTGPAKRAENSSEWKNKFYGYPDLIFYKPSDGFYSIDIKGFRNGSETDTANLAQVSPYNTKRLFLESDFLKKVVWKYTSQEESLTLNPGCFLMNKEKTLENNGLADYIKENLNDLYRELGCVSLTSTDLVPSLEIAHANAFSSDMSYTAEQISNRSLDSIVGHVKNRIDHHGFYPVEFCLLTGFDRNLEPITCFRYSPRGIIQTDFPELKERTEELARYKNLEVDLFSHQNFKKQYETIIKNLTQKYLSSWQNKIKDVSKTIDSLRQRYHMQLEEGASIDQVSNGIEKKKVRLGLRLKDTETKIRQNESIHENLLHGYNEARTRLAEVLSEVNHNYVYQVIEEQRQQQIKSITQEIKMKEESLEKNRKLLKKIRHEDNLRKKTENFKRKALSIEDMDKEVIITDKSPFRLPRELYLNLNGNKTYRIGMFDMIQI